MFSSAYNKLLIKPLLKSKFSAYGGSSISPVSTTCILQWSGKDKSHNMKFYVVIIDSQLILGLKDCEKVGLAKRVNVIEADQLTKSAIKE